LIIYFFVIKFVELHYNMQMKVIVYSKKITKMVANQTSVITRVKTAAAGACCRKELPVCGCGTKVSDTVAASIMVAEIIVIKKI
jgi:hypothetical protein